MLPARKKKLAGVRLVVLGSPFVGKSALAVRFITKRYIGDYVHDGEKTYKNEVNIDGEPVYVEVLDTCSGDIEGFPTDDQLQWADGAVLVYSVTDRRSFNHIKSIKEALPATMCFTLVASKADMAHTREVTYEEGENLAKEFGCAFYEVSAAEQVTHAAEGFIQVIRDVLAARRKSKNNSLLTRVLGGRSAHRGKERAHSQPPPMPRPKRRFLCFGQRNLPSDSSDTSSD